MVNAYSFSGMSARKGTPVTSAIFAAKRNEGSRFPLIICERCACVMPRMPANCTCVRPCSIIQSWMLNGREVNATSGTI